MPLGLVKLKQGTYSVELTSGGTTLTPFKAVIKPSITQPDLPDALDSTFQKLPQSSSEPIESTGNEPLPQQINLVTEDDKLNNNKQTLDSNGLPLSQNQPLENNKGFLTADQVSGQRDVQIEKISQSVNDQIIQSSSQDQIKTKQIGQSEDNQLLKSDSDNQALPNSNQNFSVNQNLNNTLNKSNEQISQNNPLPSSENFASTNGTPISQNNPLQSSENFASSDGTPISQNNPLQSSDNFASTSGGDTLDSSFISSVNQTLESGSELNQVEKLLNTDVNFIQSDSVTPNTDSQSSVEYQKLPNNAQSQQVYQYDIENINENTPYTEYDQLESSPQKLTTNESNNFSQNIKFQENETIAFSDNQKLVDSTSFAVDNQTIDKNQTQGSYEKIPDVSTTQSFTDQNVNRVEGANTSVKTFNDRLTYNNISQNSSQNLNQGTVQGTVQGTAQGDTPGDTPGDTQGGTPGAEVSAPGQQSFNDLPGSQSTTQNIEFAKLPGSSANASADQRTFEENVTSSQIDETQERVEYRPLGSNENEYQTRQDSLDSEQYTEDQQVNNRILSSTLRNAESGPQYKIDSTESTNQAESDQYNAPEYVQLGEQRAGSASSQSQINNFNFDTDMPSEFYEFKGNSNLSNEQILEEFINSDTFKRLDQISQSAVLTVRQSLQLPEFKPSIAQESQSLTQGTLLQDGRPIQSFEPREVRSLGKLFTRNRQSRPGKNDISSQSEAQKKFEETNGLKQKISLTFNKVFNNNEKFASLPEYVNAENTQTASQQSDQLQNDFYNEEYQLGEEDYQFGDEDKIYTSPKITGVRETLDDEYQEELRRRRRRRRNLRYLPVGAALEPKFLPTSEEKTFDSLPDDEESNIYRQLTGERERFQSLTISEQEQNKIALRKAEHDIQQELNKALEENINIKENAENKNDEITSDSESVFYKELVKERERFQQALLDEREQNKAALRRSEDQIQRQLIDVLTSNPQSAPTQTANDPISQVVRSLVDSGKDKEEIIIDATRIIQMIQNTQAESGGQEIDEYLLRQRIERELKYEFKQMQLEHEQKMKLIYRRMIEDMYIDMLNS